MVKMYIGESSFGLYEGSGWIDVKKEARAGIYRGNS